MTTATERYLPAGHCGLCGRDLPQLPDTGYTACCDELPCSPGDCDHEEDNR